MSEALTEVPVVGAHDNPDEMVVAVCSACGSREIRTLRELELMGWRKLLETRVVGHEGFWLCPDHQGGEYSWEDLY